MMTARRWGRWLVGVAAALVAAALVGRVAGPDDTAAAQGATGVAPMTLRAAAEPSGVQVGVSAHWSLLDPVETEWSVARDTVAREFSSVTPTSTYFATIHPCPPRRMVDPATRPQGLFNAKVQSWVLDNWDRSAERYGAYGDPTKDTFWANYDALGIDCRRPLETALATGNWRAYEAEAWAWKGMDTAVAWAAQNGVEARFHTLLFQYGDPGWLQPSYLGELPRVQRRDLLRLMNEHVTTIVRRYCTPTTFTHDDGDGNAATRHPFYGARLDGVVYEYDVVNEAVSSTGGMRGGGEVIWAQINEFKRPGSPYFDPTLDPGYTGSPDYYYLYKAFQAARQTVNRHCAGQEVALLYNDGFELRTFWQPDPAANPKGAGIYNLASALVAMNPTLLDGVGIQGHLWAFPLSPTDDPTLSFRPMLEAFDALGLDVALTEADMQLRKSDFSAFPFDEADDYFDEQAALYADLVQRCLYETDGTFAPLCSGMTTWGIYDRESWRNCYYPLLFHEEPRVACEATSPTPPFPLTPKPAFDAILNEFLSAPAQR